MTRINRSVLPLFGALVRARLWPDSSVVVRQTFLQRHLWPSQIKKLVARAERSNEPSTTARRQQTDNRQTTDTIEIPLTEILDRIFILVCRKWSNSVISPKKCTRRNANVLSTLIQKLELFSVCRGVTAFEAHMHLAVEEALHLAPPVASEPKTERKHTQQRVGRHKCAVKKKITAGMTSATPPCNFTNLGPLASNIFDSPPRDNARAARCLPRTLT